MRCVVLALLMLTATAAVAEWVKVGEDSNGTTHYIDPATIRKDGNFRKVWELQDLKVKAGDAQSIRSMAEYDCKEHRWRGLSVSGHSGPMAAGKVFTVPHPKGWNYTPPDTSAEAISRIVCAK